MTDRGPVSFLRARLEEERAEVDVIPDWFDESCGAGWGSRGSCRICGHRPGEGTMEATGQSFQEHLEHAHRRSRVLAEVEAKARILSWWQQLEGECRTRAESEWSMWDDGDGADFYDGWVTAIKEVLAGLAESYSQHADYDPSWQKLVHS